jgi:hypothetical protein
VLTLRLGSVSARPSVSAFRASCGAIGLWTTVTEGNAAQQWVSGSLGKLLRNLCDPRVPSLSRFPHARVASLPRSSRTLRSAFCSTPVTPLCQCPTCLVFVLNGRLGWGQGCVTTAETCVMCPHPQTAAQNKTCPTTNQSRAFWGVPPQLVCGQLPTLRATLCSPLSTIPEAEGLF